MSISTQALVAASMTGFAVAFLGCVVGLFAEQYRDNLAQHLGMIGVGAASALKIEQIYMRGSASPETALLAVGLALFGLGVAFKVWEHRPRRRKRRTFLGN